MTQIDHPEHYGGDTTYEAIKVIEAWGLGFHLGNAVKYIKRHDQKGGLEDLRKARWYLDRIIEEEPATTEPGPAAEPKPDPEPILDPGIPASAADRAVPEPEPFDELNPHGEDAYWQEMKERDEETPPEPEERTEGEIWKPCKTCGETKSLDDFPRNGTYKDGHTNKCKLCTRDYHRQREQGSRDRLSTGRGNRQRISVVPPPTPATEARSCANGTSCAAVDPDDLVPTPAILGEGNPGPLCRRCQKRAGVA